MTDHDIAHRFVGDLPQRALESDPDRERTAAIEHEHATVANDKADIRVVTKICGRSLFMRPVMHEIAGCYLLYRHVGHAGGASAATAVRRKTANVTNMG